MKMKSLIWEMAKTMPTFTIQDFKESGIRERTIRTYISAWVKSGYIRKFQGKPLMYELIDAPDIVPTIRGRASHHKTKEKEAHMWFAMRKIKETTPIELSMIATIEDCAVSVARATEWLHLLTAAGYLRKTERGYRIIPSRCKEVNPPVIEKLARVTDGTTGEQAYLGPWRWIK